MTDQELENKIRETLQESVVPSRESLSHVLSEIGDHVTKSPYMRYNVQTVTSNIINNKFADIVSVWKSKRIILIPSFIVLFLVSAFSLSTHSTPYDSVILDLAEQSANLEQQGVDYDDQVMLTSFDEPDVDDFGSITNEI